MKTTKFLGVLWLSACIFSACSEKVPSTTSHVSLDEYEAFGDSKLEVNSHRIRSVIDSLVRNDSDGLTADFRTRRYYRKKGDFLWIDRHGLTPQADTLLAYLRTVGDMGFSPRRFCVPQIEGDIDNVRQLHVDDRHTMSLRLARLEYYLTKAYLRYTSGQRFGYLNPTFVFNRTDSVPPDHRDTIPRPVRFRNLFDVKMEHCDDAFYAMALGKIGKDSVPAFLREIQPQGDFYHALVEEWREGRGTKAWRTKVLCNMERSRWRLADYPQQHRRYVLVNIPSFHLYAVDGDDTLSMRIGCGSFKTKTPLLTSAIKRMDVNPQWVVPRSIAEKEMSRYFSRSYCERRGFYVMDRSTGKEVEMSRVHAGMLHDPNYAVVQRGGKGNSLGRLIFRFDNNFAVYLHDTSSRDVFSRNDRGVSHGCVRVEKPYELAKFILKGKSDRLLDNLYYCMTADSLNDKSRIIGSIKVDPQMPLYLTYYTIYPMRGADRRGWVEYPDVYGYDKVIYQFLKKNYQ